MQDFEFFNPTRIIFGKSSMDQIGSRAKKYGKKVLLAYGQGSIKKNGIYEKVMEQLKGFDVKEFAGIEPNPRVETLRKCIDLVREFEPDLILAVGGGSVIDGVKLVAAASYYEGDAWDFLIKEGVEPKKYVPFAVVLTAAATNSEMNSGTVITNWTTHEKLFFFREQLFPQFSILDPQNTYSVSKDQTAYGVIDAFSHGLEQYINTTLDTPMQDRWVEGILLTLIEYGPIGVKELKNYEARANLMLCADMVLNGLVGMAAGQDWATHNMEHEISAFYDIPHPAGLAIITPRWMQEVRDQKTAKLIQYGKRVWGLTGSDDEIIDAAIKKTFDFFKSLGAKMSLNEWNIDDKHFDIMVERLATKGIGEIKLSAEQIERILRNCLK